jgi:oxygen-independent coproporphyrinogen-3 oxidase
MKSAANICKVGEEPKICTPKHVVYLCRFMAGLYIHIPFCRQACYYCDFHFSTNTDQRSEMIASLVKEMAIQKQYLGNQPVETIYLGGGTPSLLDDTELAAILSGARENFLVDTDAEVTVEANPDDLSPSRLEGLKNSGVNRLSIGIQSFQDEALTFFNRAHSAAESLRCLADARKAGFTNISIDLIYGIPCQDDNLWRDNIAQACSFSPEHISAYALTIEEKTVFGRRHARGQLPIMTEDQVAFQFELLMEEMKARGYEHYEISNFSRPGRRSRHNTSYWEQKPYLGIGPSAHSYDGRSRQHNVANNSLYIKSIGGGTVPFERELLSRETLVNEYIMTRLRTSDGLNLSRLKADHGFDLLEHHRLYIAQLTGLGKIRIEGEVLLLTSSGKLLADKISSDLFVISE